MKKKIINTAVIAAILTAGAGIVSSQAAAGILAEGNISVYKGGKLSDTVSGKTPVDENSLLVCEGKCMIKSTGISIVGAGGTELAVKGNQDQFNILLKNGKADFILSGTIGKMGFYTADRQYAVADVVYNASTATPVRGYMQVAPEGDTKVGVYEGRLIFDTVEGAKTVDSNNYILLAQAVEPNSDSPESLADITDDSDWECNNDNIGRLCDKDSEDWYCNDEAIGEKCDNGATGAADWGGEEITAAVLVGGTAVWGGIEYFDDDDDPDPNPSPNN